MIYVAYNSHGDLIAEACSYHSVVRAIERLGYSEDEVLIARVTP